MGNIYIEGGNKPTPCPPRANSNPNRSKPSRFQASLGIRGMCTADPRYITHEGDSDREDGGFVGQMRGGEIFSAAVEKGSGVYSSL